MDWIILLAVSMLSAFPPAVGFNIDPVAWRFLRQPAAGFGYKVVQRSDSSLLVSAPLAEYQPDRRGQIYRCSGMSSACSALQIPVPDFAVNMSLGLTMTSDPNAEKTLVCGPTIPKDCRSITTYSGACWGISVNNRVDRFPAPASLDECRVSADIAFLLDGSGSVSSADFSTMKTFVKDLIRPLLGRDTQFSIAQYSFDPKIHLFLDDLLSGPWESVIDGITQLNGGTYTARAIQYVVDNVFSQARRSRPNVKKVLIVITDGQSNDFKDLAKAVLSAERKNIVRFAIGVGRAFSRDSAKKELDAIASSPQDEHVHRVDSFQALEDIRGSLQDSIFSIEGSHSGGDALRMEMAQEGFSAAYLPGPKGGYQTAAVGAYEWKGGYKTYSRGTGPPALHVDSDMEPASYLGYSMTVAKRSSGSLTILGAPRYEHRGAVLLDPLRRRIDPVPLQIGAYFGAEVCAMDVDGDGNSYADIILISAPMFKEREREGRVYICLLTGSQSTTSVDCQWEEQSVLKGDSEIGRFGSSLAPLPDLNGDGANDLAVGAPLENDGQGSIYIFHGGRGTINPTYTQRIAGSDVRPGLQFFGLSISQSSFDLSGDSLPDLAVGSKGAVLLLRSKPIVMVGTRVSFSPTQIPSNNKDCLTPLRNAAVVCFTMTRVSRLTTANARINYTLTLDVTRKPPNNRAYIREDQRDVSRSFTLGLRADCFSHTFYIEACPEDSLNEVSNELTFSFEGLPSSEDLRPSLSQQVQTTTYHPLGFEINCGDDDQCVDNLNVDFNFTGSSVVRVGIDSVLDVMVWLENREENSYNSRVVLTYPADLSYSTVTQKSGRVECNSVDSVDGVSRGQTICTIDKPIFRNNAKALFVISYWIDTNSKLDRKILITANATSGNNQHSAGSDLYKLKEIEVKYSILVEMASGSSYTNFTAGKSDLQKPVHQSITILNFVRVFDATVVIQVPVKLGNKYIWVDPHSMQIPGCQRGRDVEPALSDFVENIKRNHTVDCSVARCLLFKCNMSLTKDDRRVFNISANMSSGWIQQIGVDSAKFLLISTATLEYDTDQYIFQSSRSTSQPSVRRVEFEVEVYPEADFTKEIIGGSLGGLLLLALITAGLYKAGFFKSQFKQMVEEDGGGGEGEGE